MENNRPCLLMILDGWGIGDEDAKNAIFQAKTPYIHQLKKDYATTELLCFGKAVGLPDGIMGNSEVGHLNMGAGRVVYQDLLRIDLAINKKTFFENKVLNGAMSKVKQKHSTLHLMGLVSDGGVHSQMTHLFALIQMAKDKGVENLCIHVILDGRDTPPDSGIRYTRQLVEYIHKIGFGKIASVCGRYYAMDRDTRWERTEKAYNLYTEAQGVKEKDPLESIQNAYEKAQTDEFVQPIIITDDNGRTLETVSDNDGIIFFNFRADRARQITRAFTDPGFDLFDRKQWPKLCDYVCMTLYDESFTLPIAFGPEHLTDILGEVMGNHHKHQLRIAETEKYAHVTYFFNGGEETAFSLEDRCMIPSPRNVATYDEQPEMSAYLVTEEVIKRIKSDKYDLIVLNFANMDMVGHTGIMEAAIKACEVLDECVGKVISLILEKNGTALVTADHGNAEKMIDENNTPHTAHTLNPVPFILVNDRLKQAVLRKGALCDIAATILDVMEMDQPRAMTGKSLIEKKEDV